MSDDQRATPCSSSPCTASGLHRFRTKSNCLVCGRVKLAATATVRGKVKKWHGISSCSVMYDNVTCVSAASLALRVILRRVASPHPQHRTAMCGVLLPQHLLPHKSVRNPTSCKGIETSKSCLSLGK
jgi:hypothetical protein